ncbi:hypothetical protein K469DRAFT_708995 [Zopfia rhizophila CBS 207.26]|uniref:Nuclear envelope protein n=1 Tax=Zopfia rhizophila CBS 207.26 TaxID=1314779 RepID=A0A6A6DZ09_9PEZI|nr:hypothetical protein K469DRAFT_708995 [Zopfia rhizophila CBS 207.26]
MALATAVRPYRDFFLPSLHRRFASASVYTFGLCFVIAILIGEWDSWLWSWFPVGPTGVRALLLYIPSLLIYVLRVAQWHVGQRNTAAPWQTFWKYALRLNTLRTLAFYFFSAWFFSEIYLWSRSGYAGLGHTDLGKLHERIRLNERPLYLRTVLIILGVAQAMMHLWKDYDRIPIPVTKPKCERKDGESASNTSTPQTRDTSPSLQISQKLGIIIKQSVSTTLVMMAIGFAVYFFFLRNIVWTGWYNLSKWFTSLAKTSRPTGLAPFAGLLWRNFWASFFLVLLWEFTNTTFDIYIAQEPLKKDKPITNDSKDPNGSLLNGLRSKKEEAKNIAFWELALITDRFDDRRKTIYGELERKKAPTHKQIVDICLAEVRNISNRIDTINNLFPKKDEKERKPEIELVPRISQPLREDQIAGPGVPLGTRLQRIEAAASQIARTYSSPDNATNAGARRLIEYGDRSIHEGAQQAGSVWDEYWSKFAASPIGWFFRSCVRRTANVVINGSPYSHQSSIANAITTLTNLAVSSLKEDEYGQFNKEVPEIVRVFASAIKAIESYMQGLEVDWMDVDCLARPEAERKKVPEVEVVVERLKEGLERILRSFAEYLGPMGMTAAEIREAKELVARTERRGA